MQRETRAKFEDGPGNLIEQSAEKNKEETDEVAPSIVPLHFKRSLVG